MDTFSAVNNQTLDSAQLAMIGVSKEQNAAIKTL
jgi:hypothetical protein